MCAFRVLPDPPNGPIEIAARTPSEFLAFPELAGGAPLRMFIRIVRVSMDGQLAGGSAPIFKLAANNGDPISLPRMLANVQTARIIDGNHNFIAEAGWIDGPLDTFLITIDVFFPGNAWALQIVNDADQTRQFTAVVGDNDGPDDGARQPWLHAPTSLSFSANAGATQPIQLPLRIANRGTGPLTVESRGLTAPFQVLAPEPIEPNSTGSMTVICTPGNIDSASQTLTLASDDGAARASGGHNNVVTVSFNRSQPPDPGPDPVGDDSMPCTTSGCTCFNYLPRLNSPRCNRGGCGHLAIVHKQRH